MFIHLEAGTRWAGAGNYEIWYLIKASKVKGIQTVNTVETGKSHDLLPVINY